jgi:hypothetical protein
MRIDPLTFAVALGTMWAAHDIADHVVQTDHQAGSKADPRPAVWIPAMVRHVGGYQLTQVVALTVTLRASGLKPSLRSLISGSLISAVSHTFLDRRWPVKKAMCSTGSRPFAEMEIVATSGAIFRPGMYQADQALHHGFLWLSALAMAVQR